MASPIEFFNDVCPNEGVQRYILGHARPRAHVEVGAFFPRGTEAKRFLIWPDEIEIPLRACADARGPNPQERHEAGLLLGKTADVAVGSHISTNRRSAGERCVWFHRVSKNGEQLGKWLMLVGDQIDCLERALAWLASVST